VNLENELVLKQSPFPWAMDKKVVVNILWPRERDFIAAVFSPAQQELPDGDPPDTKLQPAQSTALRNNYGTTYGDWGTTVEGPSRLPPLLLPELNRLVLATDEVIRIDVGEEKELSRFKLPLQELVNWSVDSQETYCVTGYAAGRKVLVALSAEGQELWRW